jgi:predicted dehydrogenase
MIPREHQEDPVRYAFIGCGHAARTLHLPAVRSLAGVRVVGAADPDPAARGAFEALGVGPVYADAEAMLAETTPDVAVVATPPDSHAALCLAALRAGAHVLVEKPFVATLDEADAVLAEAARRARRVAVNHEFREMPIFAAIPPLVGAADVGRPVFLQFLQLMDLPPWEEKVPWRAAMPNRTLFEGGVHIVDLAHMLLGRIPERVFAVASAGLDPARRADAIHLVTMDYGGGLLAQITIDRLSPAGTRYLDLRLDCERASIRASYGGRAFVQVGLKRGERPGVRVDLGLEGLAWVERGLGRRVLARNRRGATARATRALHAGFLDALRRDVEPPTTARIARETLAVIEACYRSAATGRPIALDGAPNGGRAGRRRSTRARA